MSASLWLAWALLLGLVVAAVLGSLASRRLVVRLVPWVLALAGAIAVGVATRASLTVSDEELDRAVTEVADRLDRAGAVVEPLEIRRQIGERLGSTVDLVPTADEAPDTADRQVEAYEVTLRGRAREGPAACLTVTVSGAGAGTDTVEVTADRGRCPR